MKISSALLVAAMLYCSPALAAEPQLEPCHAILLHYPTAIKKVVPADPDLVDIFVPSDRQIMVSAKRGKEDRTVTSGGVTTTTSRTSCQDGATNVVAFDEKGEKVLPDQIDNDLTEVNLAWPPLCTIEVHDIPGRLSGVQIYYCDGKLAP